MIFNMKCFWQGAVRVDRATIFGNPFVVGRDGTREEVIEKFRIYALDRFERDEPWREAVRRLRGKDLACWCAPKACHASVLEQLANQ